MWEPCQEEENQTYISLHDEKLDAKKMEAKSWKKQLNIVKKTTARDTKQSLHSIYNMLKTQEQLINT